MLHWQFWCHIQCYPISGSIDEKKEHETLLKHLTFAMLGTSCVCSLLRIIHRHPDVSTSPTSNSSYTASEYSVFIESIEKTPEKSRTWPIARVACFMAHLRFLNYYGHPSARLSHLHAIEVEQTEKDAPASIPPTGQMSEPSTWRRRVDDLCLRTTTFWYSMAAVCLRLCSVLLFDTPVRHHTSLKIFFVDKIIYERIYRQSMKTLLEDWSDASLLSTVLWTYVALSG